MSLFVRGCQILVALLFIGLLYFLAVWVFGLLGIHIPERILQIIFAILILLAIIGGLTGRYDGWWKNP
jgi:hypothetical protein